MTVSRQSLLYGDKPIHYQLSLAERKTMEIAVLPDGQVVVKAPAGAAADVIHERVRRRAAWIRRQQDFFARFEPRTPPRRYVGGESHRYLGRQYRLKIAPDNRPDRPAVILKNGYFHIVAARNDAVRIKKRLDEWYRRQAQKILPTVMDDCWRMYDDNTHPKPTLHIRTMKTRWGSLSRRGTLTLNTKLIQASKLCIEYVIIHELCHLKHHNHSPRFYRHLSQTLPTWQQQKQKLELALR